MKMAAEKIAENSAPGWLEEFSGYCASISSAQ